MLTQGELYTDRRLLDTARGAWMALSGLRARRARLKGFTYGRQWGDKCRTADGRTVSEEQRLIEDGRTPVTNNIIRRMVKSIIGRYRYMCTPPQESGGEQNIGRVGADLTAGSVTEGDARLLEEFLISGMAVQRVSPAGVENISPERVFWHEFRDSEGKDIRFAGVLHDMSAAEVMRRFSKGDVRRARLIRRACNRCRNESIGILPGHEQFSFDLPSLPDSWRVVEIWRLTSRDVLHVHDPFSEERWTDSPDALERLEGLNKGRAEVGTEPLEWKYAVEEHWECYWLTPRGEILGTERAECCPVVMKLYPLIDGEIHSLVEDVVDQQKYVNRLISMLDHIISSSAKGVLLYPADQLPEGFTWKDLRRIWANPMGILPFRRTSKAMTPQQVNGNSNAGAGATEMLKMQLQLFDEISGATGAMSGKSSSATGEGMLRAELENATISMLDVLAAFRSFIMRRDRVLNSLKQSSWNS